MRPILKSLTPPAIALVLTMLWPGLVHSQAVPVDEQASMLLRALSYDRALAKRSGGKVNLAVIYKGDAAAAGVMVEQFRAAKVKGVTVTAQAVAFESTLKLLQLVDGAGINAMYAQPSIVEALSGFLQVSRGRKIASLGGSKELVNQGIALGVYRKGDTPWLLINERASRVEGLDLDPEIKLIATVVE